MRLTISQAGSIERLANMLAAAGSGQARMAMARALNHEGDKGRTLVKRELVTSTGVKYSMIVRGLSTHRATGARLQYELRQKGNETNIGLFQAVQRKSGVSAAPWNVRRVFGAKGRASFFLPNGKGGSTPLVFIRKGGSRHPIEPLFGPNIAREIVKNKPKAAWESVPISLADRIAHELSRMI